MLIVIANACLTRNWILENDNGKVVGSLPPNNLIFGMYATLPMWKSVETNASIEWGRIVLTVKLVPFQRPCFEWIFCNNIIGAPIFDFKACGGNPPASNRFNNSDGTARSLLSIVGKEAPKQIVHLAKKHQIANH